MKENLLFTGTLQMVSIETGEVLDVVSVDAKTNPLYLTETDYIYKKGKKTVKYSRTTTQPISVSGEKEGKEIMNNEKILENNETAENELVSQSLYALPYTLDETLNIVYDETAINAVIASDKKTFETVKFDNKEMAVMSDTRDLFIDAYRKCITIGNNVEWAQREVIARTMDSPAFKKSFINEGDYALQIGVSKSYLSKAKTAVKIYEWLKKHSYGTNWKATAVEELIGTWNDLQKKKIGFDQFMQYSEIHEGMTVSEIRKGIKKYKDAMTPKEVKRDTVNTTSISANTVDTVNTTSISANTVDTVNTTSISANTVETVKEKKTYKEVLIGNELNISVVVDNEPIDIWLNRETDKKLFDAVVKLISGRIKKAYDEK